MNIVIAGATGLVGTFVLEHAKESEQIQHIHILSRRPLTYDDDNITVHEVNYEDLSTLSIPDIDAVVCALGTTRSKSGKDGQRKVDLDYVVNTAQWAKDQQVTSFAFVSSVGANAKASAFYLKLKGEAENQINQLGIPNTFVFRPSLLLGPRKEVRVGEKIGEFVLKLVSPLLIGSLKKQRPVRASQVAKAILHYLNNQTGNHVVDANEIRRF